MKNYTERFEGLQIRDPVYICKKPANLPITYDIVKWVQTEPREVINGRTGKKEISTEYCYTVGWLKWDAKEEAFDFESCGLRWLGVNASESANKRIIEFAEQKEKELEATEEEY